MRIKYVIKSFAVIAAGCAIVALFFSGLHYTSTVYGLLGGLFFTGGCIALALWIFAYHVMIQSAKYRGKE